MKSITCRLVLPIVIPCLLALAAAQANLGQVRLVTLANPVYPPLARQARITGIVVVKVTVDQNRITQAVILSGHPILQEAALTSAQQSLFDCSRCDESIAYLLRYVFKESGGSDCCDGLAVAPTVQQGPQSTDTEGQEQTEITITAEPTCICDPAATITKERSIKCLFLWKC